MADDLQAMKKDELVEKLAGMLKKDQVISLIQTVEQGNFANAVYHTSPDEPEAAEAATEGEVSEESEE